MNTVIEKEFDLDQPIKKVWKSLADPEDIVTCVPGASITEKIDDQNFKGAVVTKFGPIKASYSGEIEITKLDEANHIMVLKGKGLDSKGKGSADMIMNGSLTAGENGTRVKFSMDITIVGMLAQFGSRLIQDVSDQLLNQFVANFKEKLSTSDQGSPSSAESDGKTSTSESVVGNISEAASEIKATATKEVSKAADDDNSFDASSLIGTIFKSIFGSIADFFRSLFGGKK